MNTVFYSTKTLLFFFLTLFYLFSIIVNKHTFPFKTNRSMDMAKNETFILQMDYTNEPRRNILCIDIKSFFASVEAVERQQHPLKANIVVVSKPNQNGGLVLAASPRVKEQYNIRTGTRIYEIPKQADIEIVEPRMALYLEKNLAIVEIF